MARTLPPPAERFDPITARWLSPGGPLHDPERDSLDPTHDEPVTLVGPIPHELSAPVPGESDPGRSRRRRRRVLVAVALFVLALLL